MVKRQSNSFGGDTVQKRPRIVHEAPTFEEIRSARQLMQLLAFDQDLQKARHGLQSFKLLLDKLNDPEQHNPESAALLRSYLEASRPREENDDGGEVEADPLYLPDVMDTWDYAAKMNNENIMSAVPVVLALLIRYLSHVLELAPVCLGICRTLLRRRQLELIARNLSADKNKEFVISPTLRMLRETITFDGGAVARPLFRARNYTYRSLARNMSLRYFGDGPEDEKRTSVRTNAVRFFLASLVFLHAEAKAELLSQREVVNSLTKTVKDDSPLVVHEILTVLREHVLRDKKLPRSARSKTFNSSTLIRLASLYTYGRDSSSANPSHGPSVSDTAHQLLLQICTASSVGVLREQTGYYPQGVEPDAGAATTAREPGDDDLQLDAGLDRIVWMDKFVNEIPVSNFALSDLISTLRPWSSTRQSELLLSIFRSAPELIAWYFIEKKNFTFEPKISATWVGYAALLFKTILVDIPAHFGNKTAYARAPPPTSVTVDNILPRPLSQKTMSRCLTHKSKLISFFAVRLLALAMEKLRLALQMHREAASKHPLESLWKESERRTVDEFCRRCPPIKDIISAYRNAGDEDLLFREAASRVLRLYYEVVPQVALTSKFDVSLYLFAAIQCVDEHMYSGEDKSIKLMELENLLAIAGYSPGMQWFSKAKGLAASPFVALLKVYIEATGDLALEKIRTVLDFVACEGQLILAASTGPNQASVGLSALVESTKAINEAETEKHTQLSDPVWALVDNCIVRCANAPIKYIEMMHELTAGLPTTNGGLTFDPITMALAEQLRFATAAASSETHDRLALFLREYLLRCRGDEASLKLVLDKLLAVLPNETKVKARLAKVLSTRKFKTTSKDNSIDTADAEALAIDGVVKTDAKGNDSLLDLISLEAILNLEPIRVFETLALSKWSNRSADELVEEGYAAGVIGLLTSEDSNIRRQALVNLTNMAAKIRESTYDEKDQVWLLLSELVESVKTWMTDPATTGLPVPSHFISFAIHALDTLRNPLHCLYAKVNAFLTAGPTWRLRVVPLVRDILHDGPSDTGTCYAEIRWLLVYLLDSLRTPADVELFRSRRLFESLLSIASNPYMRSSLRRQILRILCRVSEIEGGSTTLITRCGIVSWLNALGATDTTRNAGQVMGPTAKYVTGDKGDAEGSDQHDGARIYQAFLRRLWDTCDQERVKNWSLQGVQESIAS
ncbi:hypothetical protein SEPCBS119000_003276 [Sporothrix epigloea]|uniref:Nucleolar pre-ribosomal-associated protein 1 n=1 Tax=Sporothrix epigloea TaxID=1892477 RepID=A0ABP0DPY8_9PEZI